MLDRAAIDILIAAHDAMTRATAAHRAKWGSTDNAAWIAEQAALLPQIEQLLLERTGRSIAQLQLMEGADDAGLIPHGDETDLMVQQLPRS